MVSITPYFTWTLTYDLQLSTRHCDYSTALHEFCDYSSALYDYEYLYFCTRRNINKYLHESYVLLETDVFIQAT